MRVAIAGAGNVGRSIARELLANDHRVLLIDRDPGAIKPDSVPGAEWLPGATLNPLNPSGATRTALPPRYASVATVCRSHS